MRGAVIAYRVFPALLNDTCLYLFAGAHVSLKHFAVVNNQSFDRAARILYMEYPHWPADITLIANLAAAFSVKWSRIHHYHRSLWCADPLYLSAVYDYTHDFAAS